MVDVSHGKRLAGAVGSCALAIILAAVVRSGDASRMFTVTSAQAQAGPFEGMQPYLAGISVSDVERVAGWYEQALGFTRVRRMDLPDAGLKIVFLKAGSFRLELIEKKGASPVSRYAPGVTDDTLILGLKKIAFLVPNLDAAAARLKARGTRFLVEPFRDDNLKLRSFIVADPDGNAVQFMEERRASA